MDCRSHRPTPTVADYRSPARHRRITRWSGVALGAANRGGMAVFEERTITVDDGARIAYEVRADHPDGLPILALHGVLVGTSNWIHQMLRLPQFHWIAPAIRGHGDSSPAGDAPTIERAALDAVAVLDAEWVERAVVIGNSLGATVALALALLRPERVIALLLAEPSIPQLLPDRGGDR